MNFIKNKQLWLGVAIMVTFAVTVVGKETFKIGHPLAQLPTHIPTSEGNLTLFADFDNRATTATQVGIAQPHSANVELVSVDGVNVPKPKFTVVDGEMESIPVYLINRTGKPIVLNHQDGDLYVKLEYQNAGGDWIRGEPHNTSWCGNSYWPQPEMVADSFVIIQKWLPNKPVSHPAHELPARIRFGFYHQDIELASNVGNEILDRLILETARFDDWIFQNADFDFVRRVAYGTKGPKGLQSQNYLLPKIRLKAIQQLGDPNSFNKYDHAKCKTALQQINKAAIEPFASEAKLSLKRLAPTDGR